MNRISFRRSRLALAATAAFVFAGSAMAATMNKAAYEAGRQRIVASYEADRKACSQTSGDAQDLCLARAAGKEKVARAQLAFDRSGKASDHHALAVAMADADESVAQQACKAKAGQARDVCQAEAKATHTKALADATLARKVGRARTDAMSDKRDAEYQLADEKCDSLAGDAKTACTDSAKTRYGKR